MNLYTDNFDEYSDTQTMVSPNTQIGVSGIGHLPALWLIGLIVALVIIRIAQPYIEK